MGCEILRSPIISYRSLLYSTTVLYDIKKVCKTVWLLDFLFTVDMFHYGTLYMPSIFQKVNCVCNACMVFLCR